jgi:hypothetical protein
MPLLDISALLWVAREDSLLGLKRRFCSRLSMHAVLAAKGVAGHFVICAIVEAPCASCSMAAAR